MDHRDFWVAVAAAAPVIGLTHVVVWERFLKRATFGKEALAEARKSARWRERNWFVRSVLFVLGKFSTSGPYWVGTAGFVCALTALIIALSALAADQDVRPGSAAGTLLVLAMLATVAQSGLAAATETIVDDIEDAATTPDRPR